MPRLVLGVEKSCFKKKKKVLRASLKSVEKKEEREGDSCLYC